MKVTIAGFMVLTLIAIGLPNEAEGKIGDRLKKIGRKEPPSGTGCRGRKSGDTYTCNCKTGQQNMKDGTVAYNQCKIRKARHGEAEVIVGPNGFGLAVYSHEKKFVCGQILGRKKRRCKCTCFTKDAVDGIASPRFKAGNSGLATDCLGLCGANCEGANNLFVPLQGPGFRGFRFASILIHDICQSYIRSTQRMPNANSCSDEGFHATKAAVHSEKLNGKCPP